MTTKNPPLDQYDEPYPAVLEDEHEITEYCAGVAVDLIEEQNFLNHYRGCRAVLRLIPASELTEGWEGDNKRFPARERKYEKLDPNSQPPLLVEKGTVRDGSHRLRVGLRQGKTEFWCYDVEYDAARDPGPESSDCDEIENEESLANDPVNFLTTARTALDSNRLLRARQALDDFQFIRNEDRPNPETDRQSLDIERELLLKIIEKYDDGTLAQTDWTPILPDERESAAAQLAEINKNLGAFSAHQGI
jgi:hypothetical protein